MPFWRDIFRLLGLLDFLLERNSRLLGKIGTIIRILSLYEKSLVHN